MHSYSLVSLDVMIIKTRNAMIERGLTTKDVHIQTQHLIKLNLSTQLGQFPGDMYTRDLTFSTTYIHQSFPFIYILNVCTKALFIVLFKQYFIHG